MKHFLFFIIPFFLLVFPSNLYAKEDNPIHKDKIKQSEYNDFRNDINENFDEMKKLLNDKRVENLQQEMKKQYEKLDQKIQLLEQKLNKPASKPTQDSTKNGSKNLGKWWWKNSLTFDPMPEEWLYHSDLTYSWARMTGNAVADDHDLQARFVFRKNRVTSYFRYNFDKKNRALGDDGTAVANLISGKTNEFIPVNEEDRDTVSHNTFYETRIDILENLYTSFGAVYDEDNLVSIDQRIVGFIGIGGIPIQKPNYTLDFYCAVGKEKKEYIKQYHDYAKLLQPYSNLYYLLPNYKSGPIRSDVFYLQEKFQWTITKYISIEEDFLYIRDFRDADKYRWSFNSTLLFQINPYIGFSIVFSESFDNTANILLGRKRDNSIRNGIQIVF